MPKRGQKIGPKAIHMLDTKDKQVKKACYKRMHKAVEKMVTQSILSKERRALLDTDTGALMCEFKNGKLNVFMPRKFNSMMWDPKK